MPLIQQPQEQKTDSKKLQKKNSLRTLSSGVTFQEVAKQLSRLGSTVRNELKKKTASKPHDKSKMVQPEEKFESYIKRQVGDRNELTIDAPGESIALGYLSAEGKKLTAIIKEHLSSKTNTRDYIEIVDNKTIKLKCEDGDQEKSLTIRFDNQEKLRHFLNYGVLSGLDKDNIKRLQVLCYEKDIRYITDKTSKEFKNRFSSTGRKKIKATKEKETKFQKAIYEIYSKTQQTNSDKSKLYTALINKNLYSDPNSNIENIEKALTTLLPHNKESIKKELEYLVTNYNETIDFIILKQLLSKVTESDDIRHAFEKTNPPSYSDQGLTAWGEWINKQTQSTASKETETIKKLEDDINNLIESSCEGEENLTSETYLNYLPPEGNTKEWLDFKKYVLESRRDKLDDEPAEADTLTSLTKIARDYKDKDTYISEIENKRLKRNMLAELRKKAKTEEKLRTQIKLKHALITEIKEASKNIETTVEYTNTQELNNIETTGSEETISSKLLKSVNQKKGNSPDQTQSTIELDIKDIEAKMKLIENYEKATKENKMATDEKELENTLATIEEVIDLVISTKKDSLTTGKELTTKQDTSEVTHQLEKILVMLSKVKPATPSMRKTINTLREKIQTLQGQKTTQPRLSPDDHKRNLDTLFQMISKKDVSITSISIISKSSEKITLQTNKDMLAEKLELPTELELGTDIIDKLKDSNAIKSTTEEVTQLDVAKTIQTLNEMFPTLNTTSSPKPPPSPEHVPFPPPPPPNTEKKKKETAIMGEVATAKVATEEVTTAEVATAKVVKKEEENVSNGQVTLRSSTTTKTDITETLNQLRQLAQPQGPTQQLSTSSIKQLSELDLATLTEEDETKALTLLSQLANTKETSPELLTTIIEKVTSIAQYSAKPAIQLSALTLLAEIAGKENASTDVCDTIASELTNLNFSNLEQHKDTVSAFVQLNKLVKTTHATPKLLTAIINQVASFAQNSQNLVVKLMALSTLNQITEQQIHDQPKVLNTIISQIGTLAENSQNQLTTITVLHVLADIAKKENITPEITTAIANQLSRLNLENLNNTEHASTVVTILTDLQKIKAAPTKLLTTITEQLSKLKLPTPTEEKESKPRQVNSNNNTLQQLITNVQQVGNTAQQSKHTNIKLESLTQLIMLAKQENASTDVFDAIAKQLPELKLNKLTVESHISKVVTQLAELTQLANSRQSTTLIKAIQNERRTLHIEPSAEKNELTQSSAVLRDSLKKPLKDIVNVASKKDLSTLTAESSILQAVTQLHKLAQSPKSTPELLTTIDQQLSTLKLEKLTSKSSQTQALTQLIQLAQTTNSPPELLTAITDKLTQLDLKELDQKTKETLGTTLISWANQQDLSQEAHSLTAEMTTRMANRIDEETTPLLDSKQIDLTAPIIVNFKQIKEHINSELKDEVSKTDLPKNQQLLTTKSKTIKGLFQTLRSITNKLASSDNSPLNMLEENFSVKQTLDQRIEDIKRLESIKLPDPQTSLDTLINEILSTVEQTVKLFNQVQTQQQQQALQQQNKEQVSSARAIVIIIEATAAFVASSAESNRVQTKQKPNLTKSDTKTKEQVTSKAESQGSDKDGNQGGDQNHKRGPQKGSDPAA